MNVIIPVNLSVCAVPNVCVSRVRPTLFLFGMVCLGRNVVRRYSLDQTNSSMRTGRDRRQHQIRTRHYFIGVLMVAFEIWPQFAFGQGLHLDSAGVQIRLEF